MELEGLEAVMNEARESFESGNTRSLSWRTSQLKALMKLLRENEEEITRVLKEDLGKHRVEAFKDEVLTVIPLKYHLLTCCMHSVSQFI